MIHNHEFQAMGCKITALVEAEDRPYLLDEVPAWFEDWEQALSRFRTDSELSRLNVNPSPGTFTPVSKMMWDVFQASRDATRWTGGLVNPLILDALIYAGYDISFNPLDNRTNGFVADMVINVNSLDDVMTNTLERSICLPKGAHLDFGGVAKGWSAFKAMERLKCVGPALVNAGGDIAISGALSDDQPWSIGIEDPFNSNSYLNTFYLKTGGVATSGKDYRNWTQNGKKRHHIINPQTGLPAETDILTATVIAPTAMQAEAMAKAVMISGSLNGLTWLDNDESLAGFLILENGQCLESRNFNNYR